MIGDVFFYCYLAVALTIIISVIKDYFGDKCTK